MARGIKDQVAIIGMGCTQFGELWNKSITDLMVEAYKEAMEDAGIEKKDIDAAWSSICFDTEGGGIGGFLLGKALKLPFLPVTRVENFCASGMEALRGAAYAVASGACDIALAVGSEKLKDYGYGGLPISMNTLGFDNKRIGANSTAPGCFAMMANAYFARYGIPPEEGKRVLAHISSKSHHNGTLAPKAHLRREVTEEQIMKAPMIAWPLGLFDCCGVSDGGAAAVVVRASDAKKYRKDPIYIKALQIAVTSGEEQAYKWDSTHVETTTRAAVRTYKEAGITNPRKELSVLELHDCFSITELVTYEDLQISPRGKAREDVESGFFDLDGKMPCQPDGGLKCFGHPIGATGLRMTYELYKQLQGKADKRQVENPKYGLSHNLGGFPHQSIVSVGIVGNELSK